MSLAPLTTPPQGGTYITSINRTTVILILFLGALRDIQSELKGYELYCFGVAKRIKGGTDLPELIESTSTSNPPRPQGLSLYGK